MMVWRLPARLGAVVGCLVGTWVVCVAPAAAAPGVTAALTNLPDRFTAGAGAATISAVVSRDGADAGRGGENGCLRVRWSLVLRVRDIRLDQVRIDRIEETGSFPVDIRTEGGAARITDVRPDPGALCRGRTVTARYRIAFVGDATDGQVSLVAEAYDANLRLLARGSATRSVDGRPNRAAPAVTPARVAERPTPTKPAPTPAEEPPPEALAVPTDEAYVDDTPTEVAAGAGTDAGRTDPASSGGGISMVQAGFLLGGLLLFLGVGLLLRLRHLVRPNAPEAVAAAEPTVTVSGYEDGWSRPPARARTSGRRRRATGYY